MNKHYLFIKDSKIETIVSHNLSDANWCLFHRVKKEYLKYKLLMIKKI